MPEGMFKDVLLYKLGDVFPGANQARDQTAPCFLFIDYPASAGSRCRRTVNMGPASALQSAWGHCRENKSETEDETTLSQRHGLLRFFHSKEKARMVRVCLCLFG